LKNTPVQGWSVSTCTGLTIDGVTLDNKAGTALGKNTDAFDIGNVVNLKINGCYVYNQDDCIAVNSGTNIVVSNMYCSGGHGLSIGSVGGRDNNLVQNVLIKDSTITSGTIGVRIKTNVGTTGLVDQVTYSNIKLIGITKYGVILEQDYNGGDAKGTPDNGVPITNLYVISTNTPRLRT
jgi:polygalacturonase